MARIKKITEEQFHAIKKFIAANVQYSAISDACDISKSTVSKIKNCDTYEEYIDPAVKIKTEVGSKKQTDCKEDEATKKRNDDPVPKYGDVLREFAAYAQMVIHKQDEAINFMRAICVKLDSMEKKLDSLDQKWS